MLHDRPPSFVKSIVTKKRSILMVMFHYFFVGWILLIPFIRYGSMYEGPKVLWFWLGGIGLSLYWISKGREKIEKVIRKEDYFFLAFILSLFVSSIFGVHPIESLVGGNYRHQGMIFFVGLWLIAITTRSLKERTKKILGWGIAAGVIIESLIILGQFISKIDVVNGRPVGTFGEPNAAAGFLVLGSYFVIASKLYILLPLNFLSILTTTSRVAVLAFGVLLLGLLISRKRKIPAKSILFTVPLILTAIVFLLFLSSLRDPSKFDNRQLYLKVGFEEFLRRPILGHGAESNVLVYDEAFKRVGTPLEGFMVERSHNIFLDILLWSGIVGLVCFAAWIWVIAKGFWKDKNYLKLGALASFLVFASLQPLGVVHWVMLILIMFS